MAANRTAQLKRRSGWLKGGAAAEASPSSLTTADAKCRSASPERLFDCDAPARYALSMVGSGLKIRLKMRRECDASSADAEATAPEELEPVPAAEPLLPMLIESDGEELLEEDGEDSESEAEEGNSSVVEAQQPMPLEQPRSTVEIVYKLDGEQASVTGALVTENCRAVIKRLIPIASVPLDSAAVAASSASLATVRSQGLGLVKLVERLYDRQLSLLVKASYADCCAEETLLMLPAARLPWASLTVHRLSVTSAPSRPPPDWWTLSDGPASEVNLNSLRRSDLFKQQFGK